MAEWALGRRPGRQGGQGARHGDPGRGLPTRWLPELVMCRHRIRTGREGCLHPGLEVEGFHESSDATMAPKCWARKEQGLRPAALAAEAVLHPLGPPRRGPPNALSEPNFPVEK